MNNGDRVKVVKLLCTDPEEQVLLGEIGTVVGTWGSRGISVDLDNRGRFPDRRYFYPEELELLPKTAEFDLSNKSEEERLSILANYEGTFPLKVRIGDWAIHLLSSDALFGFIHGMNRSWKGSSNV